MKIADLLKLFEGCGSTRIRVGQANPDLVAEAILLGAKHRTSADAQIIGLSHHYTVRRDRVEVELVTTSPVDADEAKRAAYAGYTLSEYRKVRGKL